MFHLTGSERTKQSIPTLPSAVHISKAVRFSISRLPVKRIKIQVTRILRWNNLFHRSSINRVQRLLMCFRQAMLAGLLAGLAVISVVALALGIGLGHVRTGLGLAVVLVARAVVDLGTCVHPDLTGSAARGLRHRARRS